MERLDSAGVEVDVVGCPPGAEVVTAAGQLADELGEIWVMRIAAGSGAKAPDRGVGDGVSGLSQTRMVVVTTVPVLPVADFRAAARFYQDKLGFGLAFEAGPTYGGVARGRDLVHLDGVVNDAAGKVTCRIETADVEPLYRELEPRGVIDPAEPLRTTPWGATQFSVLDLDGNRITFTTPS